MRSVQKVSTGSLPHHASLNPLMWGYPPPPPNYIQPSIASHMGSSEIALPQVAHQPHLPEISTILVSGRSGGARGCTAHATSLRDKTGSG